MPRIWKVAAVTMLAPVGALGLAMIFLAIAGMHDDEVPADVAIVLGNRIEADGQPSPRLRARLQRALELYDTDQVPHIIVSGGMGLEGFDEATVMREWLIARGVAPDDITADHEGVNTWATARNARDIMHSRGMRSAYAVSQYFHVPRAKMALRRFGIEEVYGAAPVYFELRDIYSTAREVAAYAAYWFRKLPPDVQG